MSIVVVGAGAAGLMAAISAASLNKSVILVEKNEKSGKKIYITGKGRCNITNACDRDDFFENIVSNPRFLYSAFDGFSNWDMYAFLEENGLPLKIERGERVFPDSDKSSDVIRTLENKARELGVDIRYNTKVTKILSEEADGKKCVCGVETDRGRISASSVIVCTGGISYPSTGSDGDGYRFARAYNHEVTKLYPSLVAFKCREDICGRLQGLSLKNISISIYEGGDSTKPLYTEFGEMLFTHFGVSGPVILTASALLTDKLQTPKDLYIDLKPALTFKQLDDRMLREFKEGNKSFKNAVKSFLPVRLLEIVLEVSGVDPDKSVSVVTSAERKAFIDALKGLKLTIISTMGYNEAIVTKGGINVRDISPKTMESKIVKGLYFAGEVLDLDAFTGGFNLQIAWSTGFAAGRYAVE
ncbi:MAG: NAD(P)/FAD-dependent oxidoreductase [Lachnospiraceae bacterium]|nr:NAD(P)/FAD-dependent oxidoreductase [Lachnospiraceae bacterium]